MANLIEEYIYIQEVNRIIQGLAKVTGKPPEHIDTVWKDTEREVLLKHKYGVTDRYKHIGKIVKSKMGVKDEEDKPAEDQENPDEKEKATNK
mgnify:CR=1 FL=1